MFTFFFNTISYSFLQKFSGATHKVLKTHTHTHFPRKSFIIQYNTVTKKERYIERVSQKWEKM